MNNKELFDILSNAYEYKKIGDREIRVISEKVAKNIKDDLLGIQRDLDVGFDLSYEITATACGILYDMDFDDLENADFYEKSQDTASVYTNERLSVLNCNNQSEISDIQKEYDCDIQTACAVWYEQKVAEACEALREYIQNHE
jgi:hypothetical protein